MDYFLKCVSCGREYARDEVEYTCTACGDRVGTLEIVPHYNSIKASKKDYEKNESLWQFEKLLPVEEGSYRTHLHVGGTPLYSFSGLLGIRELLVKYDGGSPTASFKDRASAVVVTKACEKGYDTVYCASTGNAAASLAGLTAVTSLKTYIFLPASAPAAKISQLFVYGARVIAVDGTYDQAFDLSLEVGRLKGWYSRNSAINPYSLEGKKTGAYEICVQNGWRIPDVVLVGVGDGTVISSFYKGFYDFYRMGFIDKIPQIIGVQAAGSDAVKRVFERGEPYAPLDIEASTIADSISVGKPRDVIKASGAVKKSGGFFVAVQDREIMQAVVELAANTGVFGEPAGAVAYAGLKKLIESGKLQKDSSVCIVVTGNGLKDISAVARFVGVRPVKPDISGIMQHIKMVDENSEL